MSETYVLDASFDRGDGVHCFCPVEFDEHGEVSSIVVGMNYLSSDPPHGGRLAGIVHADGQEACDAWCAANAEEVERLTRPPGPDANRNEQ